MKRIDFISLLFLFIAIALIFYPVFSADYLYTDDANQIWLAKQGLNFNTSIPQGRYITYKLLSGCTGTSAPSTKLFMPGYFLYMAGYFACPSGILLLKK